MASIGISLNPALNHAYLVPRDGAICLDISYMGLLHIAQEIGSIKWGQSRIVYANDNYVNLGIDKEPKHTYQAFGDRGEKVGVYCTVKLPNGDYLTEEMSAQQVDEVRNTSKSKDSKYSPWATFEEQMWRKSVIKRASKYWPKSSDRLNTAINEINKHEGIEHHASNEPSDIDKLHMYASDNHTPMELFAFLESFRDKDEEYYLTLYRRFEKNKKGAGYEKHAEGGRQFRAYMEIFKNGDELEIDQASEELTELEFKIINKALKSIKETSINEDASA
jgi:recombinational DNA repair protein RecT